MDRQHNKKAIYLSHAPFCEFQIMALEIQECPNFKIELCIGITSETSWVFFLHTCNVGLYGKQFSHVVKNLATKYLGTTVIRSFIFWLKRLIIKPNSNMDINVLFHLSHKNSFYLELKYIS
jgi:hypothetical protein